MKYIFDGGDPVAETLVTRYDIDGIEFDFRRCWTLFRRTEVDAGVSLLTELVQRVRARLDELSLQRGKYLQLCVRSLESVSRGRAFGIDIADWDAKGLIDMVNVSPSFIQTTEINLEDFQKKTPNRVRHQGQSFRRRQVARGNPKSLHQLANGSLVKSSGTERMRA